MKLERTFTITEDEVTIRGRAAAFLERSGYKLVASQPLLSYRRGAILGFASLSPNAWRVNASINMVPISNRNQVAVTLDIDTTMQWVTEKERAFWKAELDCLETSMMTGVIDTALSTKSAQSTRTQNF